MMRCRFAAALVVGLYACSDDPGGAPGPIAKEGCLSGATGLDCKGKCVLRQTAAGKTVPGGGAVDVAIGALQPGGFTVVDFAVQNDAAGASASALRIIDIRITDDADKVFKCYDGSGKTECSAMKAKWKRVAPSGVDDKKGLPTEERFRLRYDHKDNAQRAAKVCLDLVGDPEFKDQPMCFTVQTVPGKPLLTLLPADLVFPYVPVGQHECKQVQVSNSGDAPLTLAKVDLATVDPGFTVSDGKATWKAGSAVAFDPAVVLAPGKGFDVEVCFQSSDELPRKGVVLLKSDDPAAPLSGRPITLKANSAVPCLKVDPFPKLNFGAVVLGKTEPRKITLKSCGAEVLEITGMKLLPAGQEHFTIDWQKVTGVDPKLGPSAAVPLKLLPNETMEVPATYTPSKVNPKDPSTGLANPDQATVEITANVVSKSVQLEGIGVGVACPEPKITVKEGEQVEPQTVLHLIGDKSVAPGGGTITKHIWTVKSQPAGTKVEFVPSATFPNPTVQVNAAGEYVFCLKVLDGNGVGENCDPACLPVLVVPSSFLHVELLWKTPLDKNELDQGPGAGSDMDLHLAHPFASGPDVDCDGAPDPWFHSVFDNFWFNEKPEWGQAGNSADDPRLDLDDTDGAGPENINLDVPEGAIDAPFGYSVGVHHWNDHGFGDSFATVKIYVLGANVAEFLDVQMKPLDLWYVGKINWPNSKIAAGNLPVLSECKATGVPACPQKPAPKQPGKFWDAQGTQKCISPCYVHPGAPSGALSACKP